MKLKTIIIPVAAAAAMCLTACSSDETGKAEVLPGSNTGEGEETGISLVIAKPVSDITTRAKDDKYALADELRFITADVFIYADNSLTKHVRLTADEFNDDGDNMYSTIDKIRTTTGPKEIYVGLNLPENLGKAIAAYGSKQGLAMVANTGTYPLINEEGDLVTGGGTDKAFVMFSTIPATGNFVEDDDPAAATVNRVRAYVGRLVAKVTVQKGDKLSLSIPTGQLTDLQFSLRNRNKLYFPYQQETQSGVIFDPNHYDQSYAAADFDFDPVYLPVDNFTTGILDRQVKYTPENTTEKTYQQETTYASVSAGFIPEKFTEADGSLVTNTSSAPQSFWIGTMFEDGAKYYFDDHDKAVAFMSNKGSISDEYQGGICYYNLFLNQDGGYQTYRNNIYQCIITSITGVGNPNPDDGGEEEIPVTRPTNIDVEIDIVPWSVNEDEYELY